MYKMKQLLALAALCTMSCAGASVVPSHPAPLPAPVPAEPFAMEEATRFAAFNRYTVFSIITVPGATEEDPATVLDYSRAGYSLLASNVAGAPLDPAHTTVIIVHDFGGSGTTTLNPDVKNELLLADEQDVLVVDWSASAATYKQAADILPFLAEGLADVIRQLEAEGLVTLANIHFVGFGLGAHFVGMTARLFDPDTFSRITGLDPAAEGWGASSERLRRSDAHTVEVIHTDTTGARAYGLSDDIGHLDFYPNGGTRHPGCSNNACYHERAWRFFAATISHPGVLVGNRCTDFTELNRNRCEQGVHAVMGGTELRKIQEGIFRVNTGRNYPFNL